MSDTVIKVENLSKSYTIRHQTGERYTALRDVVSNGVKDIGNRLLGRSNGHVDTGSEEFWALNDVSFEVKQGERVGIIGRNGAGKSTLLKILSRITEPTKGRVHIKGRVASLLEVGTGFHPELTGRENIYLNGAILGMSRAEIRRKFDEIVDFAEVEKFLDIPVKRYSSGMYVRLAFAVAAHLESEILMVDEVLAVGDLAFQKKCMGKMSNVSEEGKTVLLVSHNMAAIRNLCENGILLDQATVIYQGLSKEATERYISYFSFRQPEITLDALSIDSSLKLQWVGVKDAKNVSKESIGIDEELFIQIRFQILKPIRGLAVGITLSTVTGEIAFSSYHADKPALQNMEVFTEGIYQMICEVPKLLLNELMYYLSVTFQIPGVQILLHKENILSLKIERTVSKTGSGIRPGVVKPELDWSLKMVPAIDLMGN